MFNSDLQPITSLDRYAKIGWDFDGTLIDHPKAPLLHRYILSRPGIKHYIITFRSHGFQRQMFAEMRREYRNAPGSDRFADAINIADRMFEEYEKARLQRAAGALEGPLVPAEVTYREWKALVCSRLGIPVLIDDRTEDVLPGCERYKVVHIHPNNLVAGP